MNHVKRFAVGLVVIVTLATFAALLVKHFAVVFGVAWVVGASYGMGLVVESIRAELKWHRERQA